MMELRFPFWRWFALDVAGTALIGALGAAAIVLTMPVDASAPQAAITAGALLALFTAARNAMGYRPYMAPFEDVAEEVAERTHATGVAAVAFRPLLSGPCFRVSLPEGGHVEVTNVGAGLLKVRRGPGGKRAFVHTNRIDVAKALSDIGIA